MTARAPSCLVITTWASGACRPCSREVMEVPLVVTFATTPPRRNGLGASQRPPRNSALSCHAARCQQSAVQQRLAELQPDFIFSFYYRSMLSTSLLKYRALRRTQHAWLAIAQVSRPAPVNWAILHGERETGATLHTWLSGPMRVTSSTNSPFPYCRTTMPRCVVCQSHCRCRNHSGEVTAGVDCGQARRGIPKSSSRASTSDVVARRMAGSTGPGRPEQIHNLVRAVAPPFPSAYADVGDSNGGSSTRHELSRRRPSRVLRHNCSASMASATLNVVTAVCCTCCRWPSRDGPLILRGLAAALAKHPRML